MLAQQDKWNLVVIEKGRGSMNSTVEQLYIYYNIAPL